MRLVFHCNLDNVSQDLRALNDKISAWENYSARPGEPAVPRVGESVIFHFMKWDHTVQDTRKFNYTLKVVDVTYDYSADRIVVELHIPRSFGSIAEWDRYFRRHRLGKDY